MRRHVSWNDAAETCDHALPRTPPCAVRLLLTFCWRHSLQARLTAVLRRDDGRVSPSSSSSVEAERLKPRVWALRGEVAKGCCKMPCGVVGDMDRPFILC